MRRKGTLAVAFWGFSEAWRGMALRVKPLSPYKIMLCFLV